MTNLYRILGYTKLYWKRLFISGIASIFFGATSAAPSYLLQYAIDFVIVQKLDHLLFPFIISFIFLFILKGIFMYISGYYMEWVGNRVMNDLRNDLFSKIIYFPTSFYQRKSTGELMSHFLSDVAMIQNASSTSIRNGIRSVFEAISLGIVAFLQNWQLACLMLAIGPLIVTAIRKLGYLMRESAACSQQKMGLISSLLQEIFVGIREIKSFNTEEIEKNRFSNFLNKYFEAMMKNAKVVSFAPACIEIIAMCGIGAVFYVAINQVITGRITPGQLASFFTAILLAYQPIKRLINVYADIQSGLGAADRIFAVMDSAFPQIQTEGSEQLIFQEKILFNNLSFAYDEQNYVFKNINLEIKKGESVGLIGPSGSGKSTFCDLLLRFIVAKEGSIKFDDQNIHQISTESLRNKIGYVSQRPFLFNDTIIANIGYAKQNATFEEIVSSCKAAFAHEFIISLPNGYKTVVGENGTLLSGGQKQRLTIARVLLKNPEILIFDEATSSLDQKSEEIIQNTIDSLTGKKTIIIISHRMSFIDKVDRILKIQDQNILEISKQFIYNYEEQHLLIN